MAVPRHKRRVETNELMLPSGVEIGTDTSFGADARRDPDRQHWHWGRGSPQGGS